MIIDWSLASNITGLILSLGGFGFTIQQLMRTAKATEAVRVTVSSLKNRMATFDYVTECMHAGKSLQHTSQLLRLRQWQDAAGILLDVQVALNRVAISLEGHVDAKNEARMASSAFLESIRELEEAADKQIEYNPSDLIMTLRKLRNVLDAEMIGATQEYMMSDLELTRAEVLDQLWEKQVAGQVVWVQRSNENSYEASVGEFSFHIDRKSIASKVTYQVWVFDALGEIIDNFNPAFIANHVPDVLEFEDYNKLTQKLYKNVKESLTLERLAPALERLKAL